MHTYLKGKLVRIIDESPRVKRFFWESIEKDHYTFKPGQFAIIHFPKLNDALPYRSYSLAGEENGRLEFCISRKDNGKATSLLWNCKVGDILEITEAKGDFILRENNGQSICFIATGTGIAPFRPMINKLLADSSIKTSIYLVYGNRFRKDILYHNEWVALAKEHSYFYYFPVLSRDEWEGKTGYVHPIYKAIFANGKDAQFYVCGWSEMIKETRNNLKVLGYNRKQYFIESYD